MHLELLIECHDELGEMPRWDAEAQALHWIDVPRGRLQRYCSIGRQLEVREFGHALTSLAAGTDGRWIVAAEEKIYCLSHDGRAEQPLFQLPATPTPHRFNDGNVDRAGRFWIGTMPNNLVEPYRSAPTLEPTGRLVCLSADGTARWFDERFACPNAICWSPDARSMYVADSVTGWLYRYEVDIERSSVGARGHFCRLPELGIPDGAAVDEEGCIWNARWGAGVIACIGPDGRLIRQIAVPVQNPTACCFGGPQHNVLFVTSARYGLSASELQQQPLAGCVFAIETPVVGLRSHLFGCSADGSSS